MLMARVLMLDARGSQSVRGRLHSSPTHPDTECSCKDTAPGPKIADITGSREGRESSDGSQKAALGPREGECEDGL